MRRTFFSFHYDRDHWRAWQVRNSWVTKGDRESRGFFDSSVFESKKRTSDAALKEFLRTGLKNCGVTCVLAGSQTAHRRWVRYELVRSFMAGKGILCAKIHRRKNSAGAVDTAGPNPLDQLAFVVTGDRISFKEMKNGTWVPYTDAPSLARREVPYALGSKTNHTFATLFSTYDYVTEDGYNNLGRWIETAARQAGR
ncbi:TIR domain-containing protein [Rubricoccus marinus]|uniref:Thoeris protein ThsB TIR-like domain-containing protein n=1 Tax=Rubricoccus marinus TaxID=716817 RepID=A0A259TV07_9BACT|nr:TIR domain-containing protein [Rubricoccus marinus]OZC01457.1 hypothetical protein BSZ36_17425 [Rubricoccus marinus]